MTTMATEQLIHLDEHNVIEFLERAVDARGRDFKYREAFRGGGCKYAVAGKPACLIGLAAELAKPGAAVALTAATDNLDWGGVSVPLLREVGIDATYAAAWAMRRAQICQDRGGTWGEALDEARIGLGNG